MLLEALSDAAGEITRELAPGSVEVRLRGRDPEFVVTKAVTAAFEDVAAVAATPSPSPPPSPSSTRAARPEPRSGFPTT